MSSKKTFITAIATIALTGCASFTNENVSDDFECAAQKGFGCISIKNIRSMIAGGGTRHQPQYNGAAPLVSVSGVPKYSSDVILKVHLGNFVDEHGNYHDDSTFYVVARQGGWEVE